MNTLVDRLAKRPMVVAMGFAVVAVVLLVVALTRGHSSTTTTSRPAGATEGVAQRAAVDLHGQGVSAQSSSSCFTAYVVQAAGRDAAGQQHYALTLTLRSDPASVDGLVRTLGTSACASEQLRVAKSVGSALHLTSGDGRLVVDYRTPSGARVILPG
ncbi:MAG TPA: hypothetical protein VGQ42_07705 [Candidatus Dormibacteraeota bacterium]|nr:hypothetical protein [Candidatus Dormibacteraeota bacterium]